MASDITVSGLTAAPGIGHVALQWQYNDPNANGLPYMAIKTVEVWAHTSNDRGDDTNFIPANAVKVAEGARSAIHPAIVQGSPYFYWARAVNREGGYGAWHPSSKTAGIRGRQLTADPIFGDAPLDVDFLCSSGGQAWTNGVHLFFGDGDSDVPFAPSVSGEDISIGHTYAAAGVYLAVLVGRGAGDFKILDQTVIVVR